MKMVLPLVSVLDIVFSVMIGLTGHLQAPRYGATCQRVTGFGLILIALVAPHIEMDMDDKATINPTF